MFAKKTLAALLAGTTGLAIATPVAAQSAAATTTAGTTVSNTASVSYTVNGTANTTTSNTATFVVDRKVNFTVVTDQTGYTQVNLGDQGAITKYKVTNTTNAAQDFLLDPDQSAISLGILPGTDNFDVSGMTAYADVNGNGIYDPTIDTATYIDELAPDASVTVFVVANIPAANANIAWTSLHVTVAAGGVTGTKGAALVATDLNLGNADNVVDVVFADDDSDTLLYAGDIARNGQGRAYSGYEVGTRNVALTVAKSARIVSDGVNLANFKAIPGAVVEYCLVVSNATLLTPAKDVVLADNIPAHTTYVPGSLTMGAPGLPGVSCTLLGLAEDDDDSDGTETDGLTASFNTSTKAVSAKIATVTGGTSVAAGFRVTIN